MAALALGVALASPLALSACWARHGAAPPAGAPAPIPAPPAPQGQLPAAAPPGPPPGTPDWRITHPGPPHAIEGFADRTSVLPGQPVRLFVSTTAKTFTATAYRIGNYRSEALQVFTSAPQLGAKQADFVVQQPTNTVVAPWNPSLTLDTTSWQPGDYLIRLDGDSGAQQYVPLTVRTASNRGRIVIINAVTTWQAYNKWGGYSLYLGPTGEYSTRARAVSFDRPYHADTMQGAGDFLYFEFPFVVFAERSGHRLGYATDVDLHADPHLLDGAAAVVTLGHDEYWSAQMRNNVVVARDHGVNLGFLGGNEIYRHIRFGPSPLGPDRVETDYKSFSEDPLSRTDPNDATQEWRDPPNPRPESAILGNFYQCNPVRADMVVADPNSWLLNGIVAPGQRLPGMVGNEYSGVDLDLPTPRPLEVLFHSPVTCRGRSGFQDSTYYTAPSGAAVFSSGTQWWVCGVDPGCTFPGPAVHEVHRVFTAMTTRLLDAYAAGPAG
ncbi:MAG TPA: N,N-dimethylformamidase beta subunit family domain-containing protein, partial [Streptosporangiaceae bacterium]|nr:N,N-dimethylformamidase beta subunit family domain-containing protein [Streptosporangiaceae bacterium]